VLPFENLTGDAAQDYFVDGVTDALTTHLAQVDGLEVISRTSARQYKQPNKRLPAIGAELKVDAVLEGAVVRSGDRVRISAQLVHAASDRHVWARTYDGEVRHILALQQRIASEIATAAGHRPAAPSSGARPPPAIDPQAYDAYLKGITARGLQRYEGYRAAVGYFEQAVASQPDFAEAYAALAQSQLQFLFGGPVSPRDTIPKAEAAVRKALELDPTLAQAHRTLGQILTLFYWKWDEGEREFERAAQLSRRSNESSGTTGEPTGAAGQSLIRSGRFAEAVFEAERARKQDPLSFAAQVSVATAYRAAGQHDRAIAELRRALEMNPGHTRAHFQLGVTYVAMGRLGDAIRDLELAVRSPQGANTRIGAYLGYAYAAAGRPLEARRVLHGLESLRREQYVSSFGIALIHDALGEKDPALMALERAYEDRAVEFAQMAQYPPFQTIASERRFHAVMGRIGLPR
jgi:TolB-like protein/tetratricopeptide (TPR) repeat protein